MKYPKKLQKGNRFLAVLSGMLIFGISILAVIEVIARNLLQNPTIWTADISYYLLIWAIFLGAGFAFQEHGHVRVDLLLNFLPRAVRKVVSAISYAIAIFFCGVMTVYSWKYLVQCYTMGRKTYAMLPIEQWKLVIAIVLGCIFMIVTLVFMIMDIFSDGDKYL